MEEAPSTQNMPAPRLGSLLQPAQLPEMAPYGSEPISGPLGRPGWPCPTLVQPGCAPTPCLFLASFRQAPGPSLGCFSSEHLEPGSDLLPARGNASS